ncbi:hypothetical protein JTB14_015777 [Gonioctena quinquepunctata]|nr:hypothetical protein JTB14_015777 [Gonioctena quinquepunctata]
MKAEAGKHLEGKEEWTLPLGFLTTVFQAEVYPILEVTRTEEVRNGRDRHMNVCHGSQAPPQGWEFQQNEI